MLRLSFGDSIMSYGLEECRASFETSLCEAPQDAAFLNAIKGFPHAGSDSAQLGRVSKPARHAIQRILSSLSAQLIPRAKEGFMELSSSCCRLVAFFNRGDGSAARARACLATRSTMIFW